MHMLAYLERVAPKLAAASERMPGPALLATTLGDSSRLSAAERERCSPRSRAVREAFAAERAHWIGKTGKLDWHLARQSADRRSEQSMRIDVMDAEGATSRKGFAFRDRCMADNVHALLDTEGAGAKALLWAHNGHVQQVDYFELVNMGSFLHAELGADYRVDRLCLQPGQLPGMGHDGDWCATTRSGRRPPSSSMPRLAATGIPLFALDLMRVPADGRSRAGWRASRPQRTIGSVFDPGSERAVRLSRRIRATISTC